MYHNLNPVTIFETIYLVTINKWPLSLLYLGTQKEFAPVIPERWFRPKFPLIFRQPAVRLRHKKQIPHSMMQYFTYGNDTT